MKRLFYQAAFAVLAGVALAAPARAGLVSWNYSVSPDTPTVKADGNSSTSSIALSGDGVVNVSGNSAVVVANLTALSTAAANAPETFTNAPWKATLTIVDTASGLSGTLSFTGMFSGTLSSLSSDISNTFTGPLTQTLTLGNNTYVVTATSFVPPSVPNATNTGGIGASVEVRSANNPEPSALVLCGLGAAGCALAGWRKRRRTAQPA
jgi:hypothetical protein